MMCFLFICVAGFLHHHSACPDSSGFLGKPNSHLFLQEVVLPPTSSSCSRILESPELSGRQAAWYAGKETRLRDLESTSWCCHECQHRERPSAWLHSSACRFLYYVGIRIHDMDSGKVDKDLIFSQVLTLHRAVRGFKDDEVWETTVATGML